MPTPPSLVWFRQDLRLADNPALQAAVQRGGPVIKVLTAAGIALGRTYPASIVEHRQARRRALAALATIRRPS